MGAVIHRKRSSLSSWFCCAIILLSIICFCFAFSCNVITVVCFSFNFCLFSLLFMAVVTHSCFFFLFPFSSSPSLFLFVSVGQASLPSSKSAVFPQHLVLPGTTLTLRPLVWSRSLYPPAQHPETPSLWASAHILCKHAVYACGEETQTLASNSSLTWFYRESLENWLYSGLEGVLWGKQTPPKSELVSQTK